MTPLIALLLTLAGTDSAQGAPPPDPRLRTIPWSAEQVVRLPVAANFHTAILFGPDEHVRNVAIGDSDAWQATLNEAGDALFLKPLRAGGATNMTVITDRRVYSFELSSAWGPTSDAPFTVRFSYPATTSAPALAADEPRLGRYALGGARRLRPVAVVDDGVRTSIEWEPSQTIPAVFAVDELGDETLVQGHMRDGLYVIDGVYRALVFRIERQTARATRQRVRSR